MPDAHKNFAYSTVATAPSPATSGTSLVVAVGQGALFPAAPFNAVVWPANVQPLASNAEIVRVTARTADTLTISRQAEPGGINRTIVVGDQISAAITAKVLTDAEGADLTAVSLAPATSARNVIQPSADAMPLTLKKFAGQTADMLNLQDENGNPFTIFRSNGSHSFSGRVRFASDLTPPGYTLEVGGSGISSIAYFLANTALVGSSSGWLTWGGGANFYQVSSAVYIARAMMYAPTNAQVINTLLKLQSTVEWARPLAIEAYPGQTADLIAIQDWYEGTTFSRFDKAGFFMTRKTAAPADADLVAGEMALWLDATNGAAKLMVKAKQADGTVKTGSVALA